MTLDANARSASTSGKRDVPSRRGSEIGVASAMSHSNLEKGDRSNFRNGPPSLRTNWTCPLFRSVSWGERLQDKVGGTSLTIGKGVEIRGNHNPHAVGPVDLITP